MKQTLASVALAFAASSSFATDLPLGEADPTSARIFLELHSIQQLAGVMNPFLSVPGEAFRIVEGDSLALGNLRIRLVGIEAPEMAQRCNALNGVPWECAAESEDRMRDILRSAEQVECFSNDRNSYGDYVASCTADGEDVAARLVAEGLAWPDEERGYYLPELAAAQAEGLGIWQAETPTPFEWRMQQK
ncbi:thermonuclease family protein [Pseudophaeobacter sp.]|uniref:thermonuclease family protein n=1 Tax=Pseudophaeobacter sp. TaxID=1971739 RepID=UPI003299D8EC